MPEGEVVEVWPPKTAHLLQHKPSKAQVRKAKASAPPPTPPPPSSILSQQPMASSSAPAPSSGATPPVAPKKSFLRRIVPFLLAANVAVGAYVFLRTSKKQTTEEPEVIEEAPAAPAVSTETPAAPAVSTEAVAQEKSPAIPEAVSSLSAVSAATNTHPSVSENDQRQLFKWILEEKRKVKAISADEKKKIDEEKALLKHYIRLGSIPSL